MKELTAELMIYFDVGVNTAATYHLKRVDSDYFDDSGSVLTASIFIFSPGAHSDIFKGEFNPIHRPSRYSHTEQILILRPDRQVQ